jgi:hypothetical protein
MNFVLGGEKIFLYKKNIKKIVKRKVIFGQVCHILILGCNR